MLIYSVRKTDNILGHTANILLLLLLLLLSLSLLSSSLLLLLRDASLARIAACSTGCWLCLWMS